MGSRDVQQALATADLFFQAAMGQADWVDAIASLMRTQNAAGGAIFDTNRYTGEISNWHFVDLNDTDQYLAEMNAINPRMHYSLAREGPHILADRHVITNEGMARHDFYRWLENSCGLQQFIGGRIRDEGPISTFMSVEYPAGSESPQTELVERFSLLSGHLSNALQLTRGRDTQMAEDHLDGYLSSMTGTALLFFDTQLKFAFANPAGERLLKTGSLLRIKDGKVRLGNSTAQTALERQFEKLRLRRSSLSLQPFVPIHVRCELPQMPLLIRLVQLPQPLVGAGGKTCGICLFVQRLGASGQDMKKMLVDVFGLTTREAELIEAVRQYHSVGAAADSMRIARNTGRVHMQHIFTKLKINGQLELIQLTDALSNWMPPAPEL